MIQITLTAPEARLCRDAAKAEGQTLFPSAGENTLCRGDWHDMAKWLTWYGCNFDRPLKLDTRQAADRLAARIEAVIEAWDRDHPAMPLAESETVTQLSLF